jgi:hypothetical protein
VAGLVSPGSGSTRFGADTESPKILQFQLRLRVPIPIPFSNLENNLFRDRPGAVAEN